MGIESDQLVYDYLSRVGDLAQATTLTAAERARLVTGLRQAIDDRRGDSSSGSSGTSGSSGSARAEKASVQKILTGIGTPADVVRQAVHSGVPESQAPAAADGGGGRSGAWGLAGAPSVPVQASASPTGDGAAPASGPADWWRNQGADQGADEGGLSPLIGASIGELPGWRAVYEPDFLDPDADERAARVPGQRGSLTDDLADPEGEVVPGGAEAVDQGAAPVPGFRRLLRVLRPAPAVDAGGGRLPRGPLPLVETLAALVLAAATVLGLWYLALLGWFFAYSSKRLGQRVARTAGLWLPLLLALACGLLLYSRAHGHPGQQESSAAFQSALHSTVALWLRLSTGLSTVYLAWQISRRR